MKTRKLFFTLIATMTMLFGATLTAHAEEVPAQAPQFQVVGNEINGYMLVPADWTVWENNVGKTIYVDSSTNLSISFVGGPTTAPHVGWLAENISKYFTQIGFNVTNEVRMSDRNRTGRWNGHEDTIYCEGFFADGTLAHYYSFVENGVSYDILIEGTAETLPVLDMYASTHRTILQ